MSRLLNFWRSLGPGILLAATSIGGSHLVLGPRAGMLYGTSLLWIVVVAHRRRRVAEEVDVADRLVAGVGVGTHGRELGIGQLLRPPLPGLPRNRDNSDVV